jgi:hypothetical protein
LVGDRIGGVHAAVRAAKILCHPACVCKISGESVVELVDGVDRFKWIREVVSRMEETKHQKRKREDRIKDERNKRLWRSVIEAERASRDINRAIRLATKAINTRTA